MDWQAFFLVQRVEVMTEWRSSPSISPLFGWGCCLRGLWSSISCPPIPGSFNLETAMECGELLSLPLIYIYLFFFGALGFRLCSYYLMAAWHVLWPCVFLRLAGGVLGFGENFSVSHAFWGASFLNLWCFLSAFIFAKFQLPYVSPNF